MRNGLLEEKCLYEKKKKKEMNIMPNSFQFKEHLGDKEIFSPHAIKR